MDAQKNHENPNKPRLSLHRIYQKNSSFESFSISMTSLQNPVHPVVDMQVFANAYAQENNVHQAVLGLKIEAKHKGDLVWRLQLETAGFYGLEGFTEEQEKDILHGYCMGQLYSHAAVIVTQMVTQGGFPPIYIQPMDFNRMYQEKKKEAVLQEDLEPSEVFAKRLNAINEINTGIKAFWVSHYTSIIEELSEDLRQKNGTEQSLATFKERLIECQDMVGRYTLSPACYEEGIQDLIGICEASLLEDGRSSYISTLNRIRSDFQQSLIERYEFIQECFMGDIEHLVSQSTEGKVSTAPFIESLAYYATVMTPANYYDGLMTLQGYLKTKDSRFDPLLKEVEGLLLSLYLRKNHEK